ncbi:histidine phosphatase family protein [Thiofaba sp. EF100]|uniref:histidine phosphatase family protein n=1 Tax=Thiofaba sp. EF100 TaxID=3121274 RepID=UPI003221E971
MNQHVHHTTALPDTGPRRITLLRHGATTQPGHYHGHSDVPLSDRGMRSMHQAMAGERFDQVISSPLKRCASFAQDFAALHDVPCALDADWMEVGFGAWEGKTAAEIMAESPKALKAFWRDPIGHPPPGGEPLDAATERVWHAWERLPKLPQVLVVTHGGAMRLLFCRLLGLSLTALWRLELNHVARLEFLVDEDGVRLHYFHAGGA